MNITLYRIKDKTLMRKNIILNQQLAPCKTCKHAERTVTGYLRCVIGAKITCGGSPTHPLYSERDQSNH